jgi:hypothetical protein
MVPVYTIENKLKNTAVSDLAHGVIDSKSNIVIVGGTKSKMETKTNITFFILFILSPQRKMGDGRLKMFRLRPYLKRRGVFKFRFMRIRRGK